MSQTKDVSVSLTRVNKRTICTRNAGNIYEIFRDHYNEGFLMNQMGPIFCSTLNGRLIGFPETYEQFQEIISYAQDFMAKKVYKYTYNGKNYLGGMNIAISAYSMTKTPSKPFLYYPENGYLDEVFDYTTGRLLNIDDRVRTTLTKECCGFQRKEKVCKMLWAGQEGDKGYDRDHGFGSQICASGEGPGFHAICVFSKKVAVWNMQ